MEDWIEIRHSMLGILLLLIIATQATMAIKPGNRETSPTFQYYLGVHEQKSKEYAKGRFLQMDQLYANVSEDCHRDMKVLHAALIQPKVFPWALQWDNANGQSTYGKEKGSLLGNTNALGSYDLCRQIRASHQHVSIVDDVSGHNITVGHHDFDNRYCRTFHIFNDVYFSEGWCIAETCSHEDILTLMPDVQNARKHVLCEEDHPKSLTTGAVFTVVVYALFVALVASATVFDAATNLRRAKSNEVHESTGIPQPNTEQDNDKPEVAEFGIKDVQNEKDSTTRKPQQALQRALLCFSLYKTLPFVLTPKPGGYRAVYGLKVIAMSWIMLGHTYWKSFEGMPLFVENNLAFYEDHGPEYGIIDNMDLSVDVFFFLSGFLATLSFMKTIEHLKTEGACERLKAMLLYVFHRYLRLTPVLVALIIIWCNLWPYFGSGPLYPGENPEADDCKPLWWSNLLYINNLYRGNHVACMGWAWYLAVDFQFYLVAPVFITLLYWKPKVGSVVLGLSWLINIVIRSVLYTHDPPLDEFWDIYVKPWCRFGVYAEGLFLGYLIYRTKCKVKIHWALVVLGWLMSAFLCLVAVFGDYRIGDAVVAHSIMKRDVFALGLCWVLFACLSGYGGWINTFLSWEFFQPLAKLSYCVYMMHRILEFVYLARQRKLFYMQGINVINHFLGTICLTIICSLPFAVVFEVPFLMLEKVILPSRKKANGAIKD